MPGKPTTDANQLALRPHNSSISPPGCFPLILRLSKDRLRLPPAEQHPFPLILRLSKDERSQSV